MEGHGNALSYENFADMMGKTITKITYITRDGFFTVDTNLYVPVKVAAKVSVKDALPTAGTMEISAANLPEDFDPQYSVNLDGAAISGTTITLPASAAKGAYQLTASDKGKKYADLNATFYLGDVPAAVFDAEKKALVPAEGVNEEAFKAYIAAITGVSVNGRTFSASGHHAVTIVQEDGTFDLASAGMTEAKQYDVIVIARDFQGLYFTEDYRATQTIEGTGSYKKTYGDKAFTLDARATGALSFKSDNTKVATVSETGKVTIKGAGTANITVTAAGNEDLAPATKTVIVTVAKGKQTITVSNTKYTKTAGEKIKLNAKAAGKLTYTTSKAKVATVKNGTVTLKASGTVKITVKAAATANVKAATKTVTITVKPKKVTLSSVKAAKKGKATVKWKADKTVTRYDIQYGLKKNFKGAKTKKATKATAKSITLSGLKKGKKYYVRIRAYQKDGKTYSAWSAVKNFKAK